MAGLLAGVTVIPGEFVRTVVRGAVVGRWGLDGRWGFEQPAIATAETTSKSASRIEFCY